MNRAYFADVKYLLAQLHNTTILEPDAMMLCIQEIIYGDRSGHSDISDIFIPRVNHCLDEIAGHSTGEIRILWALLKVLHEIVRILDSDEASVIPGMENLMLWH